MRTEKYTAGSLISFRGRDWVVQPSNDEDLIKIKPLGGHESEETAIFLPLLEDNEKEKVEKTKFPKIKKDNIGDFYSAKLLYNASRLSFRQAAGPFRSIAKYSFRPRAYQMVPLIMALRQEANVRLLIADDVGIGKTIESLMIVRELLDRGQIKRFAVLCLPHLCEQWQAEIKDKFSLDAVIIRSSTAAQLDRAIPGDESAFHYYPFQVISIDYIKTERRRQLFAQECPEMLIVDEAHTATANLGNKKQQRHQLLKQIAAKENQQLILLTATPHSGKVEEFQSLLGLLNPKFSQIELASANRKNREEIAQHFVQRRRMDVQAWMNEDTIFPNRSNLEVSYELSNEYKTLYIDALAFARGLTMSKKDNEFKQNLQYWTALALLRGLMSSPEAGERMIQNRIDKLELKEEALEEQLNLNPLVESSFGEESDLPPMDLMNQMELDDNRLEQLKAIRLQLEELKGPKKDQKLAQLIQLLQKWGKEGCSTIVFCRYIQTAEYIGEQLQELWGKKRNLGIQVLTSELPDEVRKEKVEDLAEYEHRILVATDCMSEGINLQEYFNAVIHYDLPWNPNRLEQREGRVDRFGQLSPTVNTALLYSPANPIDGIVLKVLLQKARAIKKSIGISVPFPEDSASILEAVKQGVLLNPNAAKVIESQLQLDFESDPSLKAAEEKIEKAIQASGEREKKSRAIFAQHAIKAQDIEVDLKASEQLIGNAQTVEDFVSQTVRLLGGQLIPDKLTGCYTFFKGSLPDALADILLQGQTEAKICFLSPTPLGYLYLGRKQEFVEQLSQSVLQLALQDNSGIARFSAIASKAVTKATTLIEFRVRNLITNLRGDEQIIAEEMFLWGYEGAPNKGRELNQEQALHLLETASSSRGISLAQKEQRLEYALDDLDELNDKLEQLSLERAEELVQAHQRFRKALDKGHQYKTVDTILPMDIIGLYVILPH